MDDPQQDQPLKVLFLGASYGAVLGLRIAAAGHRVTFACRPEEAALINAGQLRLHLPARDSGEVLALSPAQCPHPPAAATPEAIDPAGHHLVCLAMQEPQYAQPAVAGLLSRVARARVPCLSIMNVPVPPFLARLGALPPDALASVFASPGLWSGFDPALFTMASADPQAVREAHPGALVTRVTLPSNFKAAPFADGEAQSRLQRLAADIDRYRLDSAAGPARLRIRLCPDASPLVPLAKWPMLITGNFRCLTRGEPRAIRDAVGADLAASRELYRWVAGLCLELGLESRALVPFERYCAAAEVLTLPSSLARGLYHGATAVERVDRLIRHLARERGRVHPLLEAIVAEVDARLAANRSRVAETT
jgi:hypothetical protein